MLFEQIFLVVLLLVFAFEVKHFVADFIIPAVFNRYFSFKGQYLHPSGLLHALSHGILTAAICLWLGSWFYAFYLGIIDVLVHYHIDYIKCAVKKKLKTNSLKPAGRILVGVDQLMHRFTHFAFVYIILIRYGM